MAYRVRIKVEDLPNFLSQFGKNLDAGKRDLMKAVCSKAIQKVDGLARDRMPSGGGSFLGSEFSVILDDVPYYIRGRVSSSHPHVHKIEYGTVAHKIRGKIQKFTPQVMGSGMSKDFDMTPEYASEVGRREALKYAQSKKWEATFDLPTNIFLQTPAESFQQFEDRVYGSPQTRLSQTSWYSPSKNEVYDTGRGNDVIAVSTKWGPYTKFNPGSTTQNKRNFMVMGSSYHETMHQIFNWTRIKKGAPYGTVPARTDRFNAARPGVVGSGSSIYHPARGVRLNTTKAGKPRKKRRSTAYILKIGRFEENLSGEERRVKLEQFKFLKRAFSDPNLISTETGTGNMVMRDHLPNPPGGGQSEPVSPEYGTRYKKYIKTAAEVDHPGARPFMLFRDTARAFRTDNTVIAEVDKMFKRMMKKP